MKLFLKNVNDYSDEKQKLLLSDAEQSEIRAVGNADERQRRAAARCLRREVLSAETGVLAKNLVFGKTELGKPYLVNTSCETDKKVFFNISHSGEWVLCGISSKEIGVDIESVRHYNEKVAARVFSSSENALLQSSADADEMFTRLWVLKEAYLKAIGTGMRGREKEVSFSFDGDKALCSDSGAEISFCTAPVGFFAAVCEIAAGE